MKKIIIIIAAVLVLGGIGFFVWQSIQGSYSNNGGSSVPTGASGEQQIGTLAGGVTASEVPAGDSIAIGTASGTVTVKNFYKNAIGIIEGSEVVLAKTGNYEIDYSRADSSFTIMIIKGSVAVAQADAETAMLGMLGVSRADACRLAVSVIVPVSVDAQLGGRSYRSSFCGL